MDKRERHCKLLNWSWLFCNLVLFLLISSTVHATPVLRFNYAGSGGTLSYDGEGGPLKGSIPFSSITYYEDTINMGTLTCENCFLDILTGSNISVSSNYYYWHGGGEVKLTGTAKDSLDNEIASGILLIGEWDDPVSGLKFSSQSGNVTGINIWGSGTDIKNPDLLTYFGLAENHEFTYSTGEIAGTTQFYPNGGFKGNVTNALFRNTETDNVVTNSIPIPEPATLLLLGTGMVGMVIWGWRQKRGRETI